MSLASVVITSVVFAFIQYSEIASKDRIEELKKAIADTDVYEDQNNALRSRYDPLINYTIRRMPYLKGILYVILVGLVLLHGLHAQDLETFLNGKLKSESLDALKSYSWWPVSAMVVLAGAWMLWAAIQVGRFRRAVKGFIIFLEGFRARGVS